MSYTIGRRDLMKLGTLACAGGPIAISVTGCSGDESQEARFVNAGKMVPMNAANLSPTLQSVLDQQNRYESHLNQDVSLVNRRDFITDSVESSREKLARMLGVGKPEQLAFVRNTSEANSVINNGFPLEAQDEVLAWNQNHPTNRHSWLHRRKRTPFEYREVDFPEDVQSSRTIVDAFVSKLSARTRIVTFTELSNISGLRMPSKQLCQAIHDYNPGIFVHVDGAQSWGALNLDLEDMGCDSFSSSGHKWFMGPRGTGILYVNEKWSPRIWPNTLGYNFYLDYPTEELPETAERFECLGQRDTAPYGAIGDAVDAHLQLGGSKKIEAQIQGLTQYALTALDRAGIRTRTPRAEGLGHGVVIADLGGAIPAYGAFLALHNEGIAAAFVEGSRICCEPTSGPMNDDLPTYARLSPHIFNTTEEIDRAVSIVKRVNESKFEIVKEVVRFL